MATNAKPEIKQTSLATISAPVDTKQDATQSSNQIATQSAKEKFKSAIAELDVERAALVKSAIENLKPGTPFNHAALRDIQKIETRKNRLIVGWFAAMLKKNEPGIAPIVHQLMEI